VNAHKQLPEVGLEPHGAGGLTPHTFVLQSVGHPSGGDPAANAGVFTEVMTGTVHATALAAAMRASIFLREKELSVPPSSSMPDAPLGTDD
jgi:hypothetical protein